MKLNKLIAVLIIIFFVSVSMTFAQQKPAERARVPLTNPNKPVMLEVSLHNGSITVKGYSGKEVIVEAVASTRAIKESNEERLTRAYVRAAVRVRGRDQESAEAKKKKTTGMKKLQTHNIGLTIEEQNNKVEISVNSLRRTVDLTIQVPFNTSMELGTHRNGFISVENVSGDLEINNHFGDIRLMRIKGSVVAHSHSGEINATIDRLTANKPTSFSTWQGDIDVSFPAATKANLKMKTTRGDIYSDFNVKMVPYSEKKDDTRKDGKYKISFNQGMMGQINGGGQEIQFKTYNGDIYIRKAK